MDVEASEDAIRSHRLVPEPHFDSLVGLTRHIAVAGFAGLFTGVVVGGVGGRLFMRIAGAAAPDRVQGFGTEAGFTVGKVTFGGSLFLVIFLGVITGVAGAILYAIFTPWISWTGRWRGLAFGVLLFGVASASSDLMNPDNIDFFILKNSVLLVLLIALLFVSFGIMIDAVFRFLDDRMPDTAEDFGGVAPMYVTVTVAGLVGLVLIGLGTAADGLCDCGPPVRVSWSVVVAAVGTVTWWSTAIFGSMPARSRSVAAVFGYVGVSGALIFGLIRALSDAIEIIN